ncbi:MAG: O-antigen ligase family protein [Candidatus Nomurabacteria bacterium]|nr:O-antigen ligase family protein [Candidatus Nomurabacteria bacterium]USN88123.1 MAG: O-antigen ligase family protein [Candidatus Nomurabacteria bacterium]
MNSFIKAVVYGGLFAVPFLTLYVANDYFFPFITGKNFAFRILVELAFVAWVVLALSEVKYRPKFSWVLSGFVLLLVVMFFADLFGKHPPSSFWSNFERMDGYITLVHVFLYVLVLGSVLTTKKLWSYFLHTTLVVAFIVALYGMSQLGDVNYGKNRIESYLGNAAYLAIYMLFHIFIALWMLVESKVNWHRAIYGLLSILFIFTLIETGTRGTALGLGVGLTVMIGYIAIFGARYKELQKVAIGFFVLLFIGVGVFVLGKDTAFIQDSPNLSRIANINLAEDLKVRGTIWGMAWEGVKERPVLGWGQSNFNYVFNEQYDPFLFDQEQWFDRSHNIIMDWLVTGGFLGLIAYLSIFVACLYYLIVVPLRQKDDETFTVLERAVLLGILTGYFTHNLVVFDNIISYIFFAVILALIHSRVGTPIAVIDKIKVDKSLINQFALPVAAVVVVLVIYTLQVPGMRAAGDIIDGYSTNDPELRLEAFDRALSRDSFAYQEIVEQLAQQAMNIMQDSKIPDDIKKQYVTRSEQELLNLIEWKPGDARVHVFVGSFYRAIGNLDEAAKQMAIARDLSPEKQSIISQQGIVAYSQGDYETAKDFFKESYDLDHRNTEALQFYMSMLFLNNQGDEAKSLANSDDVLSRISSNDFLLSVVNQVNDIDFLIKLYEARIEKDPANEQNWVSLSFLHYKQGNKEEAVKALESGAEAKPSFSKMATCFAENIKAGNEPQAGCQ